MSENINICRGKYFCVLKKMSSEKKLRAAGTFASCTEHLEEGYEIKPVFQLLPNLLSIFSSSHWLKRAHSIVT